MKKNVLIEINSIQHYDGTDPEEVNLVTQGQLYKRNKKFYVCYEESEITGLEGTKTTLKISDDDVSMIRTGKYSSEMLFADKRRHVGLYNTGYGTLEIATHTSSIKNTIGENGGSLALDYTIEIDHSVAGYNHFEMEVTCKEENS